MSAALGEYYGPRAVWLDYDDIGPGAEFAEALTEALAQTDNLLAIIGPDWLTAEKEGRRRLDDPEDWVRREVVAGLSGRSTVTPVLVGHAQLPTVEQLPEPLQPLTARHAIEVRPEHFDSDVEDLIRRMGGWRRRWRGFPLWAWALAVTAVVGLLVVSFVVRRNMAPLISPQQIQAVAGVPMEIDLLEWATDDRVGVLTLVAETSSDKGALVENLGDGRVRYTAPRDEIGKDSFDFSVSDEGRAVTTATAHVDILLGAMSGAFNIAVAQLAVTGADQDVGLDLSAAVYDQIAQDLGGETGVAIAHPQDVGALSGATPEARAEAAAELAERVDADVVVLGTVEVDPGRTDVAAEFYLSDRNLTEAEELAGVYPIDVVELDMTDPLSVRRRTAEELQPKVQALTQLALGLSHYRLLEYPEAEALFQEALDSWPGVNGQTVVLSLLGNVRGLQDDLDGAEAYFADALSLDPDYPRARFGSAEVTYQRSLGPRCGVEGEDDVAGLENAVTQFEQVIDLPSPPLAFIPERARIEIAKIYECIHLNGGDSNGDGHLEEAREILEDVMEDIAGESRLETLTADAHFALGFYHLLKEDHTAAITEFETAVDLTRNRLRKRGFYYSLAVIYQCQLNDPGRSETYLRQAEAIPGPPLDSIQCTRS